MLNEFTFVRYFSNLERKESHTRLEFKEELLFFLEEYCVFIGCSSYQLRGVGPATFHNGTTLFLSCQNQGLLKHQSFLCCLFILSHTVSRGYSLFLIYLNLVVCYKLK